MNNIWPYVDTSLRKQILKTLKSNRFNYHTGNKCKIFENNFSTYHNIKHTFCISNATIGLEIALISLGIKMKDEVIVSTRSYFTSASCISRIGANPIFADIKNDLTIDPCDIEKKITKKTKAIICIHISGIPCDMNAIKKIANKYQLKIIEDCSQAHGAKVDKKLVGTFGDVAVWSFCNDKIISTLGEGGMIATNNKSIANQIWSLKDNGKNYKKFYNQSKKNNFKYLHDFIGTNARMTELQAVAGIYQLNSLDQTLNKRNKIAKTYTKILSKSKIFEPITINQKNYCSYYKFPFLINFDEIKKGITYQKIMNDLGKLINGVTVGCCPTINKEKPYRNLKSNTPNAINISNKLISLSINHRMTIKKVTNDATKIKNYFDKVSKCQN